MANLFIRTDVSPYRVDIYNMIHEKLHCKMYFLYKKDSSQDFDMVKIYNNCSFDVHILKSVRILSNRQRYSTNIFSLLRKENPSLVIVPEFKIITAQILLYKFIFRKHFRVVSMCDDSWDMIVNNHEWSKAHKIMRKLMVPFLDDLLLVDNRVVDWYQKKYRRGVWLPIVRDDEKERIGYERVLSKSESFSQQYCLENKKVLLFVGRLDPVKNLDLLLDSVAMTKENFVTVIVGSGELEQKLKSKANNIDKPIIFTGRYEGDDVRAWYNIADVFILPSKMEAYGAVTNEALIAGCYSLVSENAGSACLINESNGKVFNPYNVNEMARVIDESMGRVEVKAELRVKNNLMPISFNEIVEKAFKSIN